ncbi:MAG: hypothetical protein HY865_26345 [Chloroflexi bacterium]|nr:hypothetical protein [Chloroflexota bacterium]
MLEAVSPYITKDEPFGPIDSVDIDSSDLNALKLLFEQHNWTYKNLRNRPSIIIGRRGSGKTYYLRSVFFDKQYDFYTEIRTARVLGHMTRVIERMADSAVFSEMVSDLWDMVLWISLFFEIRKTSILSEDERYVVDTYLENVNVHHAGNVDDVLWTIANLLDETMRDTPDGDASSALRGYDRITFDYVKSAVTTSLTRSKKTFVILMDSLDDFQLDMGAVSRSLQGLLKLVGSMNKPRDVVDIRFCLPAEIYHRFIKISSNPNKDFRRALKLQWTAGELVLLGAQRLMFYLALYHPAFLKTISPLDLTKRSDALRLFQAVFPERITNQAGVQEETMSYILRHTQLLPRHFLMLLNSIFKNLNDADKTNPFPISGDRIINGIRQVEEFMVGEIFVAFNPTYPTAEETCRRCLPELGHKFSMGDLHRVFTRHGKAVFGSDNLFDFQRMLLEIGAIGRVLKGKETDLYIKGSFEYTVSHEMSLGQEDELCVHPLFSGIFRGGGQDRPVYPYGSVLEDEDYRESFN